MTKEDRDRSIVSLIKDAHDDIEHCAFHSRGYGMCSFASAESLMRDVSVEELAGYMDLVEEVRRSHEKCHFCHMKVLAYGEVMTFRRLPARYLFYKSEYERLYGSGDRHGRDYRAEVRETLHEGYAEPPWQTRRAPG